MSRDEAQKLLGGYATGTLTPEERAALLEAALDDQELFDQLAKEQPLVDLLSDSGARAQLLAALDERPLPWYRRWATWGVPALATALIVAGVAVWRVSQNAAPPVEVARVEAPVAPSGSPAPTSTLPTVEPQNPAASRGKQASEPTADAAPQAEAKAKTTRQAQPAAKPADAGKSEDSAALEAMKKDAAPAPVASTAAAVPPAGRAVVPAAAPAPPPPPPAQSAPTFMAGAGVVTGSLSATAGVAGSVKDASGAAIPGADVKVFSPGATTPVLTVQTAANGAFTAPLLAGDYRVEVDKAGFQPALRDAVVLDGAPTQLPVTLQVGSVNETVQVVANAPALQGQQQGGVQQRLVETRADQLSQARTQGAFAANLQAARMASQVLRKRADGSTTPVTADDLRAGETVVIRLTPAVSGYLTVAEGAGAPIVNGAAVQAGVAFETPPIALEKAGERLLTANFSANAPAGSGGGGGGSAGPGGAVVNGAAAGGRGGAAKRAPAAAPQTTTIRIVVH